MRVLILCGGFPPEYDAQSIQTHKLAVSLARQGHRLTVVTLLDTEPPPQCTYKLVPVRRKPLIAAGATRLSQIAARASAQVTGPLFILDKVSLAREAERVINESGIDRVISISSPFDPHVAALQIKTKHHSLKWTAFFSDPWPVQLLPSPLNRRTIPIGKRFNRKVLGAIISETDKVLYTNGETLDLTAAFLKRPLDHGGVAEHFANEEWRMPSDASLVETAARSVVHVGTFTRSRFTPALAEALIQCDAAGIPFLFVGYVCRELLSFASEKKLRHVRYHSVVPPAEAQYLITVARLNLVAEARMAYTPFTPSKIFDILASSRNVLAVTAHNSPLARIVVQALGQAAVVNHSGPAIAGAIREGYSRGCVGTLAGSEGELPSSITRNDAIARTFL